MPLLRMAFRRASAFVAADMMGLDKTAVLIARHVVAGLP